MQLQQIINESNNIVFFGGAGVSTESGIPDFLWKEIIANNAYADNREQGKNGNNKHFCEKI